MAYFRSRDTIEKNSKIWEENLLTTSRGHKRNLPRIENLQNFVRLPLIKDILGFYCTLLEEHKSKAVRIEIISKELIELWTKFSFPILSKQAIFARICKLITEYEKNRKKPTESFTEKFDTVFDITKENGQWLCTEDKKIYEKQIESLGKIGYTTHKVAPISSVHPSKRLTKKDNTIIQQYDIENEEPSSNSSTTTNSSETYGDISLKKRKTARLTSKLVTDVSLSTNKAAEVCQTLVDQGIELLTPSQSGIFKNVITFAKDQEQKLKNLLSQGLPNGLSNGTSDHQDKHKSKDRDHVKDKHRDRDREEKPRIKEEKIEDADLKVKSEPMEVNEEPVNSSSVQEFETSEDIIQQNRWVKYELEDDAQLVIKEEKIEEPKLEDDDEDDVPLSNRKGIKEEPEDDFDEEDDKPLIARKKIKVEKKRTKTEEEEDEDFRPAKKKIKKEKGKDKIKKEKIKEEKSRKSTETTAGSPVKGKKKKEEEENVWKWWEEEKREDGVKWTFLEHKGPVFADQYERLPSHVKFHYNGESMVLSEEAEETAGFYAKMLDNDYTTKEIFNNNFFKDWKKTMTVKEKEKIIDLAKCDFSRLHAYYVQKNEERKNRTKEEKKIAKEKAEAVIAEYGWCNIDGHKQRIGNFKIEPPGLFRGRGEHPKQGMMKRRTMPEDVTINCSKDSNIPKPPPGHRWKEVRHDNTVTWLACWNENIQGNTKYVMLNAASKLKGEKDWQKYETARRLHKHIDNIRDNYRLDWKSKEMRIRQRGVALYFIDKLALRAGNEKDEDQADTVGCCSLRFEHLTLHEEKDGKEYVVVFDFLGKDSIRYYNEVSVEKRVFKNLQLFMENKQDGDDIFDRLNTQILNKYLNELLEGLTAKVFRTYNASRTLQEQLEKMTNDDDPIPAQILNYNRANREVAILCNHQRAVPKTFDKSMANLQKKIDDKKEQIHDSEKEMKDLKKAAKHGGAVKEKTAYEKKKKAVDRLKEQLHKLEIQATDKEENKQIALGTSKLNYLDPRITVAWCKKNNIPIDKVYNKTQRQKFQWAIDMATAEYNFMKYDDTAKFSNSKNYEDEEEEDEE